MNNLRCRRCLLAVALAWLALGLAGCGAALAPPVVRTTTTLAAPMQGSTATAVLLVSADPGVARAALEARREDVMRFLRERGYVTAHDSIVGDTARADRLIRVVVDANGTYQVTTFHPSRGGLPATGALERFDHLTLIGREPLAPNYPVYPRSYRRYPGLVDPLDPFYDPFWPGLNYSGPYHRDYLHPAPLYPRYYRPTPPPVIVRPLDPPPIRPRDRESDDGSSPPTPREPPPPPVPRRDPPPDFRNEFPRPPR